MNLQTPLLITARRGMVKPLAILSLLFLLTILTVAFYLSSSKQSTLTKATEPRMVLEIYPSNLTLKSGEQKLVEIRASFESGSSSQSIDYLRTELKFDNQLLKVVKINSEQKTLSVIRNDSVDFSNAKGRVVFEMIAHNKNKKLTTNDSLVLGSVYLQNISSTNTTTQLIIGRTQAIKSNGQLSALLPVGSQVALQK